MALLRFAGGKVVEMWSTWENLVKYRDGGVLRWTAIGSFLSGVVVTSVVRGLVHSRSSGSEAVGIMHVLSVTKISHDNRTAIIFGSHPRPWRNWQTRRI